VTQSTLDFPLVNAYQPTYGGERGDAFVTKLNPTGNAFVYSTYLGGNNDENYFSGHGPYGGIAVDATYNAYVTGYTCSANFPTLSSFRQGQSGRRAQVGRHHRGAQGRGDVDAVVAQALGLHPGHISRLFQQYGKGGFTATLNRFRLEVSLPLLQEPGLSIKTIAARCGYGSSLAYIRQFKAAYGTTPGAYRH